MLTNVNLSPGGSSGVNPSAYRINKIILTNHGGREVDIAGLVTDFFITESIYSPFLTLEMNVRDDVNFIEEYQISGQEKILVSFSKNEYQEDIFPEEGYLDEITIEHTFIATEYPVFAKASNNRSQAFVIRAISPHAYLSKFKKISRAYNDNAVNIIKNILVNDLGYEENKIIVSNLSSPQMRVIIPYLDPLSAIAWILRRSFDENSAPIFCYETLSDKLMIQSYSDFVSSNNYPHREYREGKFFTNELFDDHTQAYLQMSSRVLGISSDIHLSKFVPGSQGAYSSSTKYVDIAKKYFYEDTFDYISEFDSMVWIDKGKSISSMFKVMPDERSLNEYDESHVNNISLNTLSYDATSGEVNYHQSTTGNTLNKAISYIENLDSIVHELQLYGDALMRSGKCVNIQLVKPQDPDVEIREDKAKGGQSKDEFLSGRYIVTGVKHSFGNEYFMQIRIKKDSFSYIFEEYDEYD